MKRKNKKFIGSILAPLIFACAIFTVTRSTFAQVFEGEISLSEYLSTNDVVMGVESVDGFSRVYYEYSGVKQFVSEEGQNSRHPSTSGEYLVYVQDINGAGQIFLRNIISGLSIQISSVGTNLNPDVSKDGVVVWEGWIPEENGWQVFIFDGVSVKQLTFGDMSMNADIEGDKVVYSRRDAVGEWRAVLYSTKEKRHIDIITGELTRDTQLKDGKIFLDSGKQEFELTADGLLLLNITNTLTGNSDEVVSEFETVTEEDILEEISNAQEEIIEVTITPSPDPTITITPSVEPTISETPISSSSATLE